MRYLSVCSGIEAASVAWEKLGWTPAAFAEIEPFPSAVLKHHWPEVPNLGDMKNYEQWNIGAIDVLVGGTPCQAFSVAGLRRGFDDPRGKLTLTFVKLADHFNPKYILWENVPNVKSAKGNAFGCFLGALAGEDGELQPPGGKWSDAGCVHGPKRSIVWRCLDAQYFGVAQRRKRCFLVACPRDIGDPSEILLEWEGLRRDSAPSREPGQRASAFVKTGSGTNLQSDQSPIDILSEVPDVSATIDCGLAKHVGNQLTQQLESFYFPIPMGTEASLYENHPNDSRVTGPLDVAPSCVSRYGTGGGNIPLVQEKLVGQVDWRTAHGDDGKVSQTLKTDLAHQSGPCLAVAVDVYNQTLGGEVAATLTEACGGTNTSGPKVMAVDTYNQALQEKAVTIGSSASDINHTGGVIDTRVKMAVRRLLPVECERLQGFPDGHTLISWKGKPKEQCPDGHRYKALGNSMAVPCMRWIGERIDRHNKERRK